MIEVSNTALDGVLIIKPQKFQDERGFFCETYNAKSFRKAGISVEFVQDNYSFSQKKGTLRGLHYQLPPYCQAKLVRVVRGRIFDVAVDIRVKSKTFLKWVGVELSADNGKQLFIPEGFAHGFLTLEDKSEVVYKVSNYYAPENERSIHFNDPDIKIIWPLLNEKITLSYKDENASFIKKADLF